eukprot:6182556-Pleurochrysis_carterae.AAC.2
MPVQGSYAGGFRIHATEKTRSPQDHHGHVKCWAHIHDAIPAFALCGPQSESRCALRSMNCTGSNRTHHNMLHMRKISE